MNETAIAIQAFSNALMAALGGMTKAVDKAATAASQYVTAYQARTVAMVDQTKLLREVTNDGKYVHVFLEMAPSEEAAEPGGDQ